MRVNLTSLLSGTRPLSSAVRYLLYAVTGSVVILLGILALHFFNARPAEDCNKPAAPVVVPKAPPGLIVDAPCTDGASPAPARPPAHPGG